MRDEMPGILVLAVMVAIFLLGAYNGHRGGHSPCHVDRFVEVGDCY